MRVDAQTWSVSWQKALDPTYKIVKILFSENNGNSNSFPAGFIPTFNLVIVSFYLLSSVPNMESGNNNSKNNN